MRIKVFLVFIVSMINIWQIQAQFYKYFEKKTLRYDYVHSGNSEEEIISRDEMIEEPYWAGPVHELIDPFEYGQYLMQVFDLESDSLLYSKGYSTLFAEWQTTDEARIQWRSFHESVLMPYPKKPVRLVISSRDSLNNWTSIYADSIDPKNYFIKKENRLQYPSFDIEIHGDPKNHVDVLFLPEGYVADEMGKFISDCKAFTDQLFEFQPYTRNREKFNIRGIWVPSEERGNDIPADTIWKQTALNTSYYTFNSERYCMTYDFKTVRDLAANAPYDQIYILVNREKYGGGAIYNFYNVSVNSNLLSAEIFVHEFGHGFAGLGDEYYTSSTSYNDFYKKNTEPWEPNLTTLIDFESKWKHMLKKSTPIPTPSDEKYRKRLGVFEGGGYVSKGVYRPAWDCLMNSFEGNTFCGVCETAIQQMIDYYAPDGL